MAANPWFRMYSEFATDAKVQSMPEAMQRRLLMLMCLRCSNVLATLHDDEIAFALHISDAELAETKTIFLRKKFIDEGWRLLNWDKRQFASDSSTERSRRHRETKATGKKLSCNVAETAPDTDTDKERAGVSSKPKALSLPEWVPADAWQSWHDYRNSRKGWTHKARELSLRTLTKLHEAGHDPRAVIEQSIERGWTGLFQIGESNASNQRGAGRKLSAVEQVEHAIRERRAREADAAGP